MCVRSVHSLLFEYEIYIYIYTHLLISHLKKDIKCSFILFIFRSQKNVPFEILYIKKKKKEKRD